MTSLSVVVPAYNEEEGLPACIAKIRQVLSGLNLAWEIIIVNDGSLDKTGSIAKKIARKYSHIVVVENKINRGYGGSLRSGFAAAKHEFITIAHADNQFDFSEISSLLSRQAETKADIVSGIRPGGGADPLYRKINRWAWNTLIRAMFGYLAKDIDCGFKLFRRDILHSVRLTAERGAMIDTQLFAGARARGFTVVDIPVTHLPRTTGTSTGANAKVIIQSFVDLLKYWWQLKQEILVEQGIAVFRWEALAILAILVFGSFVRLYKIDKYLTFLGDEGRDAVVARDIILGRNFPLIGPGTSIGNMYLGPVYYYMMAVPLWVAGFSPVGPAVQVAIIGVATIALLWWVGRQWFGRMPALVVCSLYASSPTIITRNLSSWNPNIMPFFALLAMYSLWKIWRYGYWRWLTVTGVSLAFVLQSHYLGLLLVPVVCLFWTLAFVRHPDRSRIKHTWTAIALFSLLMSPLLVFDLNPKHKWLNTTAFIKFFSDRQTTVNARPYKALPNLFPVWTQVTASLVLANNSDPAPYLAGLIAVVAGICLLARRNQDLIFTLVWLGVGLTGLALYKQHVYDHYYGFLYPAVFLLMGFLVKFASTHILAKLGVAMVIAGLLSLNFSRLPLRYPPNNQLDHTRQIASLIQTESRGQPFNMALLAKRNYDQSYRYFFQLTNAAYYPIHDRLAAQLFVICEDPVCEPIGNPLWEIAAFGWAKIDKVWEISWGTKVYRLIPNPTGHPV